ncbi:MAG: gliding motility-associated C-terminal domain-containing protein [Saprospiraceae bacterium]|nr:gliding motility-associated C-terminal domain-containing protein [Saprospiraceae bacterium]
MVFNLICKTFSPNKLEISIIVLLQALFFQVLVGDSCVAQKNPNAIKSIYTAYPFGTPNGCNITVDAGPDITICEGIGRQINGVVTGGYNSISWDPTDGLSNPNVANPVATPMSTTTYTLIARGISGNLFLNGSFETGGIGPSTSGYNQYTVLNSFAMSTGGYMVMSVPQIASQFGCNPPIGAFTMAVTPTGSGTNFLCQTIPISPNTIYKIKFKCFGIPYIFGSPPVVNVKINGNTIGSIAVESGLCTQTDADFMWNSGPASSANICFSNTGGTGPFSMFAIDDIEFRECCEVKDEVVVTVYELIADVAIPDEINCTNSPMVLDGSGSTSGVNIKYEWTTSNGNIVSGDKTNKATIDKPGSYTFKVIGEFGCEKKVTVNVTGNTTPPDITAAATDIDCKNQFAKIEATSKVNPVSFEWTGPNGFNSTRPVIVNIREPGEYEVTVTDDYGCKSTKKVIVGDKRTEVFVEIKGDTIQCGEDSVQLIANSVSPKPSFTWKRPDTTIVNGSVIFVKDTGWYYITVKDSLGCFITDSFKVLSYKSGVPISLISDQINCKNNTVQIKLLADTSGSVIWNGPNGFISSDKYPVVKDSGWYFVTLSTKDGCIGKDSIYISSDFKIPDLSISSADTLSCIRTSVNIVGTTNTPNAIVNWTGPNGLLGNSNTYTVMDSGNYVFTVEAINGCLNSSSLKIYKIQDTPKLNLRNDTLDCLKRTTQLIVSDDTLSSFSWTGPNGFISNSRIINFDKPGTYKVNATSKFGCTNSGEVIISENLTSLSTSINNPQKLTCINKSIVLTANPSNGVKYTWSNNSNQQSIIVNSKGIYKVTVSDLNDICTGVASVLVEEDTTSPVITLNSDGNITCSKKTALLSINSNGNITYKWSNGDSTSNVVVNSPGSYRVTVTDTFNGCTSEQSIAIAVDTTKPILSISSEGNLNCNKSSTVLSVQSISGVVIQWSNGSDSLKTKVTRPGTYTVNVTDPQNGCNARDSIKVGVDSLFDVSSSYGPLTCLITSVTINAPNIPNASYQWNTNATTSTINVNTPGTYTVTTSDGSSCINVTMTTIKQDTTKPKVSLSSDEILCKTPAFIYANVLTSGSTIKWNGPNGFNSDSATTRIFLPGLYFITIVGSNGCTTVDSVEVIQKDKLPDLITKDDTLNCGRRFLNLFAESITNGVSFEWSGPNSFLSFSKNPRITEPGIYSVKVTDPSGCENTKQVFISIDTTGPLLDLSADTLSCKRSTVPIKAGTNIQGFNILWIGPGGFTSMFPQAIVNKAGIYSCTLTNPRTQCKTTKTIEILEDTNRIRSAVINKLDAVCGSSNGSIQVVDILGGQGQYQYSIDGGINFVSSPDFANLLPGKYSIIIKDRNGCEFNENIEIITSNGVDVDSLPDLDLSINEKQQIILIIKNSNNPIISWDPFDQLSCNNCKDPVLTALKNQTIRVSVIDENGCRDSIVFTIRIKDDVNVFVPTTFSPNGDGVNDYFYPVSNFENLEVENLSIFDRWGNLIYSIDNIIANEEKKGWNGEYKNLPVIPGVYVYSIKYKSGDKSRFIFGDITVLR